MTLRQAYGMAVKAAIRIIAFYAAFVVVALLGLWIFTTRDDGWIFAGGALAVFGTVMSWITLLAVIIKTSVDEAARRSARHIDGEMSRMTSRVGGRSGIPGAPAPASLDKMSWREAFGRAAIAALGIIVVVIIGCSVCAALGVASIGVGVYVGFSDTVSSVLAIFLMILGASLVVLGTVVGILFPFVALFSISIRAAAKRSERRIDAAARIITDRLDELLANEARPAKDDLVRLPPANERPKSFAEAMRRRDAETPISERPSPFAEAARRRAAAQADRNETQTST